MDAKDGEKSRKDRRKDTRLLKNKKKLESWMQHQQSSKLSKVSLDPKLRYKTTLGEDDEGNEGTPEVSNSIEDKVFEEKSIPEISVADINSLEKSKKKIKKLKTKFSEYLELEAEGGILSMEDDLRLERKLAKKLKVKNGRLGGVNDEINMLIEGIPSVLHSIDEKDVEETLSENTDSCKPEKETSAITIRSSAFLDAPIDGHDNGGKLTVPKDLKKINKRKTKFEEYIEMEDSKRGVLSGEDMELERKLAKKLKVKGDTLNGDDDNINEILDGVSSLLDRSDKFGNLGVGQNNKKNLDNKSKKHRKKTAEQAQEDQLAVATSSGLSEPLKSEVSSASAALVESTKYVAPHLRSQSKNESAECIQARKRVRGLLNRLSESNVESITAEISTIFHSVGRSIGSQMIVEEVLASCSGGPRGNEQYAATFAAFVSGLACSVGIDFGAKLLASLAICFEMEYQEEDNLSLRNLTLLLSYLFIFGLCSSVLIYDFLITLSKRLTEVDVSTILTVLQTCGMNLRSDDPTGMKSFIDSVQQKVHELKAACENGQSSVNGKRMEFMLETICDIKNNKKRTKNETVQLTRIKKWLQKLRVEDVMIRGVKWSKLFDKDKKGQWWLSGDIATKKEDIEIVASKIGCEVPETQKMLELAASLRMNTDARRAIFCIIMSAEDYKDALVKLLGLDLPGKQDREIMRVLIECCLQEKIFNKYYCLLAHELCCHDKNHKFTLQYCIWDHLKEVESMSMMRSMHLSKLVAEMVSCFSLSLASLKVVDFSDPSQLTPKRAIHFRMLFEAILEFPDKHLWNVFSRIAGNPDYELLRSGIVFFVTKYVGGGYKTKVGIMKKAMNNVKGMLK